MKRPAFHLDRDTERHLIEKLLAICEGEGFRLHGAATEPTHLHAVVSWTDSAVPFTAVRGRIKNLLSLCLSRRAGTTGRPWFAKGASRKRVRERRHLEHLLSEYLPRHSGVQWYEDRGWVNCDGG